MIARLPYAVGRIVFFALLALGIADARAVEKVTVAAAANLVYALEALTTEFKRAAPTVAVTTTTGASGNLVAQITHGAPFDVFLSADTEYSAQLVATGFGVRATLRTFATGRLVVWTTRSDLALADLAGLLRAPAVRKIAIAQPKSAPYGRAAQAALEKLGLWAQVQPKIVYGENISQTAQFVETGSADAGFVGMSLVLSQPLKHVGRWHEVPAELYATVPLDQAAVLTRRGADNPAAQRFLEFLGSASAKKILRDFGYRVP